MRHLTRFVSCIVLTLIVTGLLLPLDNAYATGETYSWTNREKDKITASGGQYSPAVLTLTKATTTDNNVTFTTSVDAACNKFEPDPKPQIHITVTVATDNYASSTYPTPASVVIDQSSDQCKIGDGSYDPRTTIYQGSVDTPTAAANNADTTCDQGSLTWIMCPTLEGIKKSAETISNGLAPDLLRIHPIGAGYTPTLYSAWNNVRGLTNILFVFAFLIIIFSNILGLNIDQYTIKRTLPRLVVAAIGVQFSFLISSFIIDIGNVLGDGIQGLIFNFAQPIAGQTAHASLLAGILTIAIASMGALIAIAFFGFATLMIVIGLLLTIFALFLAIGARFIIIAVLVVISPLALLAWTLPTTEHYFRKWHQTFIRLILMYPLIMIILAVAGRFSELLSFGDSTTASPEAKVATTLIQPFILLAALALVPFTFKWAGGIMSMIHTSLVTRQLGYRKQFKEGELGKSLKERSTGRRDRLAGGLGFGKAGYGGRAAAAAAAFAGGGILNPRHKANAFRRMNAQIKAQRDDLENLAVNKPSILNMIADGDVAGLRKENYGHLARFATRLDGRVAAMHRHGTLSGLTEDHFNTIADLKNIGIDTKQALWQAANEGSSGSTTFEKNPALNTATINKDGSVDYGVPSVVSSRTAKHLSNLSGDGYEYMGRHNLIHNINAQNLEKALVTPALNTNISTGTRITMFEQIMQINTAAITNTRERQNAIELQRVVQSHIDPTTGNLF